MAAEHTRYMHNKENGASTKGMVKSSPPLREPPVSSTSEWMSSGINFSPCEGDTLSAIVRVATHLLQFFMLIHLYSGKRYSNYSAVLLFALTG